MSAIKRLSFALASFTLLAAPVTQVSHAQDATEAHPLALFETLPGSWVITPYFQTADGVVDGMPGHAQIEEIFDGAGYQNTNVTPFPGSTLMMTDMISYDRRSDVYRYVILDNDTGILDVYEGHVTDGVLEVDNLETGHDYVAPGGAILRFKLRWSEIEQDSFILDIFASQDHGETWVLYFGQRYERATG